MFFSPASVTLLPLSVRFLSWGNVAKDFKPEPTVDVRPRSNLTRFSSGVRCLSPSSFTCGQQMRGTYVREPPSNGPGPSCAQGSGAEIAHRVQEIRQVTRRCSWRSTSRGWRPPKSRTKMPKARRSRSPRARAKLSMYHNDRSWAMNSEEARGSNCQLTMCASPRKILQRRNPCSRPLARRHI